ncbi:MAG: two-component system, OmpR family, sensor histidine kinase RstB [Solirubrobacteraceae bacterium]|nr:two-component system, OmpR family, sensor histidine kinase RstB [Solirubrobacteraceae bacterium]
MIRRLPLGAWLGFGIVMAVVLPALGAAGAWWAAEARQQADLDQRTSRAAALIAEAAPATLEPALARQLAALDVEAEMMPPKPTVAVDDTALREFKDAKVAAIAREKVTGTSQPDNPMTAGLQAIVIRQPDGKEVLQRQFVQRTVPGATLFLRRPAAAARIAPAGITALVLLLAVLAAEYLLLRRWVVRPLAQLSADVDQVAGGVVSVAPVASRASEVADVGAALTGMADGLRAALAERDTADEQRQFLVTAIAHDLRTPLFTLRGSLEAIEQGVGNGDHLRRAQDKAAILDGLVDDLFTFSRLEYTGADLAREPVDAAAIAREAAITVDARIIVIAPARELVVHADRTSLLRILVNILDNAIRHAHRRVEIAVSEDGPDLRFVVSDDGPGIDPDDLPHIFEPLFRADRTRNSATGGAGLGLAIVDRLAAAQGATVSADTAPSGGARFTVRFAIDSAG